MTAKDGSAMKVLLLGDRFITNEIWKEALEKRFAGSGVIFSYAQHQLQWPVVPMESNEEVSEYSGTDEELLPPHEAKSRLFTLRAATPARWRSSLWASLWRRAATSP